MIVSPPFLIPFVGVNELGKLLPAGGAPRGPEVHDHRLASKVAQAHNLSFEVMQRQVRRRLTYLRRRAPDAPSLIPCDSSEKKRTVLLPVSVAVTIANKMQWSSRAGVPERACYGAYGEQRQIQAPR